MEEEGEGFCETKKKRNQEIRPETLNSHPRSLSCPKCTLLPKVTETLFCFEHTHFSQVTVDDPDTDDPVMDGSHSIAFLFLR